MTSKNKNFLLSFLIVLFLIIGILVIFFTTLKNNIPKINYAKDIDQINKQNEVAVTEFLKVKDTDVTIGNKNAPIQIIGYDSFSCFYCAKFFTTVFPSIKKQYIDTGKVLFIHRDFPLDMPSLNASKLVKCFIEQKKPTENEVFKLMEAIFSSQSDWLSSESDNSALIEIFTLLGLKQSNAEKCLENEELENAILDQRLQAAKMLKINATPTFFINGKALEKNYSFQSFEEEITAILNK